VIFLPFETIDNCWKSMENIDIDNVPELVNTLGKEQPYMLAYLMANGNDILSRQEHETFFFMGVMIWQIVKRSVLSIPEISDAMLEKYEEKNFSMLEYLDGESETEFNDTVRIIMDKYHQAELLQYIIERLMEEPDKWVDIDSDNMGIIVIYLKTIIDCLDAKIPPKN